MKTTICTCVECGKKFEARRSTAQLCSATCNRKHYQRAQREYAARRKAENGNVYSRTCQYCGKEFKLARKNSKVVCCSAQCRTALSKERSKSKKEEEYREAKRMFFAGKRHATIDMINFWAREEHMTYGQYVGKYKI